MHVYLRFPTRAMRLNTTALVSTYARISTFSYESNDATVCACCHLFYVCTCEYPEKISSRDSVCLFGLSQLPQKHAYVRLNTALVNSTYVNTYARLRTFSYESNKS